MKALHSEIQHKSDYGLVEININNHAEAQEAYEKIISNWEKHFPEHQNKEVLVEEMADEGVEVFVGCVNDEVFGPCYYVWSRWNLCRGSKRHCNLTSSFNI